MPLRQVSAFVPSGGRGNLCHSDGNVSCLFFLVVLYWYRKNPNRWLATAGFLLYLAVTGLNVLAPGNQKRLTSAGAEQMSAIGAILRSLWEAALYIAKNTMLPSVILALLFVPLFLKIVKKEELSISPASSGYAYQLWSFCGAVYAESVYAGNYRSRQNPECIPLDVLYLAVWQ